MVDTAAAVGLEHELETWIEENWSLDLTAGEWWDRLGNAGWSMPVLPVEWYGKGVAREEGIRLTQIVSDRTLGPPGGLGLLLAAPTIATVGSDEQKARYVPDIVTGRKAWCQLFSEPGAGSDLAGLNTSAVRDGDEWVVNGQKVWTSTAQYADMGMLLCRTNPDVPKHQGLTYFAFDMDQPGVEVRPLREMTGRAFFNEVFLTDVRVPHDAAIGGVDNGWAVANTTLAFERAGLGAGSNNAGSLGGAKPGTRAGDLGRRVSELLAPQGEDGSGPGTGVGLPIGYLVELAKKTGKAQAPTVRHHLVQLYTMGQIARYTNLRAAALRARGEEIPGFGNMAKIAQSRIFLLTRDTSYEILGAEGMLHAYNERDQAALDAVTGFPELAAITEAALFAQGPPIYGGTDQIQHNILGERVLGLPREPDPNKGRPFRELPKNG
jgi:alkylation response protein AidB-like acyl-CoA dehydrogenase